MRRMSNQCCPSSRPAMQDGQAGPLEQQRSFGTRLHTEALPLLLGDEPLLSLRYGQQSASFGSQDPNLFGQGDREAQTSSGGLPTRCADPDCCRRRYRPPPRPPGSVPDAPVPSSLSPAHTSSESRRSQECRLLRSERDLPESRRGRYSSRSP